MNREDQFERRLQQQPQRPVPPAWRAGILSAARAAATTRPSPLAPRPSPLSTLHSALCTLLWPHPKAWSGLAAVWLLVLGLNFATREPSPSSVARQPGRPSPQMRELLQQQEQMLAELIGPAEHREATPPKHAAPQPRSQRREQFLNA